MNELFKQIIFYSTVALGIGTFIKIGLIPIQWIKKFANDITKSFEKIEGRFDNLENKVDNIAKVQDEHTLDILGLIISDPKMPKEKRYKASKKYLKLNGNSGLEAKAQKFMENYAKEIGEELNEE